MTKTPRMVYLRALTRIESRFATTLVSNKFVNENYKAAEATFTVTLPEAAFISHFTMRVDGKTIVGEVKEKAKAKVQYERAKQRGESAGHIAQALRETNVFHISTNIAGGGEATFNLTYQEILQRVHGAYKHVVNIQPQQAVNDLKVDVFIKESQPIKTIKVAKFGQKVGERINVELLAGEEEKSAKIDISHQSTAAHISYVPTVKKGKIDGQFVVLYDVERQENGGELQVVNGYFVHFFSPSGLPAAPKEVIFALDKSGSMRGRKMQQTKEAMRKILRDLNEQDRFSILSFSSSVEAWKPESVRATPAAVESAIKHVDKINANGGTDIYQVLLESLMQLPAFKTNVPQFLTNCMVILLTDGQPTVGHCETEVIVALTKRLNANQTISIQCIGFGEDADFDLLKKISMENEGLVRRVYEDSDAALQLQGFYAEISELLLSDVKIKYLDERVQPESIIQESSNRLYNGGEFVVVGRMGENVQVNRLTAQIDCLGLGGVKNYKCGCISSPRLADVFKPSSTVPLPPESVGGFVERMWAYLSIKQLLDKAKYVSSRMESERLKQRALELSLKYQFVTELTSMVVTQPEKQVECGLDQFVTVTEECAGGRVNRISIGSCSFARPAPHDPNYQTMVLPGAIFDRKLGEEPQTQAAFDPNYQTLTGIDPSVFDEKKPPAPTGPPSPKKHQMQHTTEENNKDMSTRYSYAGCKSDSESESEKENNKDINTRLVQMPLGEFVQQDWSHVMPLLEAETMNSLPLAKLSAIPWDDVIMLIRPNVFGGLNEFVLKSFPDETWSKVTVEQLNHLPPPMLTGDAVKHIPKEKLKQINRETDEQPAIGGGNIAQMQQENNKDINVSLVQMPLEEFVQQNWALVMPLLKAETINSLPQDKLSAIPWNDVIKLMRPNVFGGLNECVLNSFPNSAWSKVTVEQLNHLPPPMFIVLTVDAAKRIPKEKLRQIKRETMETMPHEARKIIENALKFRILGCACC